MADQFNLPFYRQYLHSDKGDNIKLKVMKKPPSQGGSEKMKFISGEQILGEQGNKDNIGEQGT